VSLSPFSIPRVFEEQRGVWIVPPLSAVFFFGGVWDPVFSAPTTPWRFGQLQPGLLGCVLVVVCKIHASCSPVARCYIAVFFFFPLLTSPHLEGDAPRFTRDKHTTLHLAQCANRPCFFCPFGRVLHCFFQVFCVSVLVSVKHIRSFLRPRGCCGPFACCAFRTPRVLTSPKLFSGPAETLFFRLAITLWQPSR